MRGGGGSAWGGHEEGRGSIKYGNTNRVLDKDVFEYDPVRSL